MNKRHILGILVVLQSCLAVLVAVFIDVLTDGPLSLFLFIGLMYGWGYLLEVSRELNEKFRNE